MSEYRVASAFYVEVRRWSRWLHLDYWEAIAVFPTEEAANAFMAGRREREDFKDG